MPRAIAAILLVFLLGLAGHTSGQSMENDPLTLENARVHLSWLGGGNLRLVDRRSGVTWELRIGAARLKTPAGESIDFEASQLKAKKGAKSMVIVYGSGKASPALELSLGGNAIQIACQLPPDHILERLEILRNSLSLTAKNGGLLLVPVREGLLIPAGNGRKFSRDFTTYEYEGCHMAMLGLIKSESALLVSWTDPYVTPRVNSDGKKLALDIYFDNSARTLSISLLGSGGLDKIAGAYREIARERGLITTLEHKIRREPEVGKLLGASNIKLWSTFTRILDAEGREQRTSLNWTFAEAAQVAEHLKRDLKIERALFMLGGWIRRGYDNQHPDILPANPECGGNHGLAAAARRVKKLGYLFCLHDNYQDMYRDSPSWDEDYLMRKQDGSLAKGGVWAGGQAWLTCSKKAVELAKRPQNLPEVERRFKPNSYFIDTTYAAGLQECYSPLHPLTRADDMRYKQEISDYARDLFGIFGSECGREWAIPHSDFFEGITGVSGRGYHDASLVESTGGIRVPFFEMVFRDCIAAFGKYGYEPSGAADYVLHHVLMGRTLNYHSMGRHLYWLEQSQVPAIPLIAGFAPKGARSFEISYGWSVTGRVRGNWQTFVHFAPVKRSADTEEIAFQGDHVPPKPTKKWRTGDFIRTPLMQIRVPQGKKGEYSVLIGLWNPKTGERAELPAELAGHRRYEIGRIRIGEVGVSLLPPQEGTGTDLACFCRSDQGWAAGMCTLDVFIKNTHEVLSPLHELTGLAPVARFELVDDAGDVRRTTFGDGTTALANFGSKPYRDPASGALLPKFGFVVTGKEFAAFHALSFNGIDYPAPALFTLRSRDGHPLNLDRASPSGSRRIHVYHGFGSPRIRLRNRTFEVTREALLRL